MILFPPALVFPPMTGGRIDLGRPVSVLQARLHSLKVSVP